MAIDLKYIDSLKTLGTVKYHCHVAGHEEEIYSYDFSKGLKPSTSLSGCAKCLHDYVTFPGPLVAGTKCGKDWFFNITYLFQNTKQTNKPITYRSIQ